MDVTTEERQMTHWEWLLEGWAIERERSAAYIAEGRERRDREDEPAALPHWATTDSYTGCSTCGLDTRDWPPGAERCPRCYPATTSEVLSAL